MTPSEPNAEQDPGAITDPFRRLVAIMARLRGPGGCPWDREQTHQSLTPYLIEEAYEVKDSLDTRDFEGLREELGDLILQVVFHAQLAREDGRFDIDEVATGICDKLIRRHPHVFGQVRVSGSGEVLRNWEDIKKQEKAARARKKDSEGAGAEAGEAEAGDRGEAEAGARAAAASFHSILSGVPQALPALLKAHRIQQKVATVGFDWGEVKPIWAKIHEEIDEIREALDAPPADAEAASRRVAEEVGDLLFSIVNLSRRLGVPAEEALDMTNRKFMSRFRRMEERLHARGLEPSQLTLDQLDALWEEVKREDRQEGKGAVEAS